MRECFFEWWLWEGMPTFDLFLHFFSEKRVVKTGHCIVKLLYRSSYIYTCCIVKGIWREGRECTHSIRTGKLECRLSHFKGKSTKNHWCRLVTSKVTLIGQSHFMLIFVLRKVTLPNLIKSVPWMYAIGLKILWLNWMKVTWRSWQTACIHGMEVVWPRLFMEWSWCDRPRAFMVRSWCDLVRGWCDSAESLHVIYVYTAQCTLYWRILRLQSVNT